MPQLRRGLDALRACRSRLTRAPGIRVITGLQARGAHLAAFLPM